MTSLSIPDPAPVPEPAAPVRPLSDPDPDGWSAAVPDEDDLVESYHLIVDGELHTVTGAWFGDSLLTVLRETLGITAVKDACEQGRCGSCSVLLDGLLVASCTVLAADAADARVTTAAGLAAGGPAPAVREALLAHGAVQCGYCTPGFVVAVTDLLHRRRAAAHESDVPVDSDSLREALSGNICRCTGYGRILAAVEDLAGTGAGTRAGTTAGTADGPTGGSAPTPGRQPLE